MKKLMTMIAAVATAFGLYADDTLNNSVDFSGYTDANPWTLTGSDGQTPDELWSYTDGATAATPAENEAKIASGKLVLKTGSKVLARKFADEAKAIGEGLFADMIIDFNNEVLDEVPEVADAKLGLFVLDGTEANCGLPAETNLYVYAAYGTDGGKALFRLMNNGADLISAASRIAIKAYANVAGNRAGFLISISGQTGDISVATVRDVYTFDGTTWTKAEGDYLGGITVDAKYSKWTTSQRSLFVSMDDRPAYRGSLASVDFKGNASITSITLTDTDPGFPSDGFTMPIAQGSLNFNVVSGATKIDGALFATTAGGKVVINNIAKTKTYVEVKVGTTKIDESATPGQYEFDWATGETLTVRDWDAAATVDGVAYETIEKAIEAANGAEAACELVLAKDIVSDEAGIEFTNANGITLDLAGQTIDFREGFDIGLSNTGVLTIIDSSDPQTGTLMCDVSNSGTLNIQAGIYEGDVEGGTIVTTGGSFNKDNFKTAANVPGVPGTGYEVVDTVKEGYWTVKKEEIKKGTVIFVCEKPELTADPFEAEVGATIKFPEMANFVFGDWTNGVGDVVTTVQEGTIYLSPSIVDIDLDKDGSGNYQIADEDDLKTLQAFVAAGFDCSGKTFKQTEDIPLTEAWAGIGTQACPFGGIYDGDNNEITGLYFAAANGDYQGFFRYVNGTVANRAVIKNLSISMAADDQAKNIKGGFDLTNAAAKFGGAAFVGHSWDNKVVAADKCGYVTLENLTAKEGTIESASHNVAGVAVALYNDVIVTGCTNKMTIIGSYSKIGGLICFTQLGNVKFTNCSNEGTVKATNGGGTNGVGGLLAYTTSTVSFENCSSTGSILIETPGVEPVLNASFVGYASNAANNYEDLGGNTTTLTGIPSVNDLPKYLPMDIGDFLFATVADTTATFVPFDSIVKTVATTYKVMATNCTAIALASGDVLKVDEAMFPLTGVVAATTGDEVTKTLVEGTVYTYTCTTPAPGPTPDPEKQDCEITGKESPYTVTPKAGSTTVTIMGAQDGDVFNVEAVADVKITVNAGTVNAIVGGCNINAFIKGGEPIDTALDDTKVKEVVDTGMAFAAGDTKSLTVNAIPGLTYRLMEGDDVTKALATQAAKVTCGAGDKTVTLEDATDRGAKAFYTIKVTKSAE